MNRIIALWCHPRSLSTAFERMVIERGDLEVIHEPFLYLYYVVQNPHLVIARQEPEILPHMSRSFDEIVADIHAAARHRPVFFKDMAVHVLNPKGDHARASFLEPMTHTFLIRDPAKAIRSHLVQNPTLTLEEVGYEALCRLFDRVRRLTGHTPAVIDAADLESDPSGTIRSWCEHVNLPFLEAALTWDKASRPGFDIDGDPWHVDVAGSTGFGRDLERFDPAIDQDPRLADYLEASRPWYEALREYRIGP